MQDDDDGLAARRVASKQIAILRNVTRHKSELAGSKVEALTSKYVFIKLQCRISGQRRLRNPKTT